MVLVAQSMLYLCWNFDLSFFRSCREIRVFRGFFTAGIHRTAGRTRGSEGMLPNSRFYPLNCPHSSHPTPHHDRNPDWNQEIRSWWWKPGDSSISEQKNQPEYCGNTTSELQSSKTPHPIDLSSDRVSRHMALPGILLYTVLAIEKGLLNGCPTAPCISESREIFGWNTSGRISYFRICIRLSSTSSPARRTTT